MARRLCKPLDQEICNCLQAECLCPTLDDKVAATPEIDPRMATFLAKYVRDPTKGIYHSWQSCQDKLFDLTVPLTKILDIAADAKASESLISPEVFSGWAQWQ